MKKNLIADENIEVRTLMTVITRVIPYSKS